MKNPFVTEKPPSLFHGSSLRTIETLEPRRRNSRDPNEGPKLFATQDKALATIFMIEGHNDSWTELGKINDIPYVVICEEKEDFIKNDKGGTIYELPSHTFTNDPKRAFGENEWTSDQSVKPIKIEHFDSVLNAMLQHGVQVYFVDKKTFEQIQKMPYGGAELLVTLQSENQKHGINVKEFE